MKIENNDIDVIVNSTELRLHIRAHEQMSNEN